MTRLLMALGICYALIPGNLETTPTDDGAPSFEVSAFDGLNALQATYSDVSGFCERNVEACMTGKAILLEAKRKINSSIAEFSDTPALQADGDQDMMATGSIQ